MSRGDSSNISMFRQQAALATKRAKEKELEFKDLLHDRDALLEEVGNHYIILDCTAEILG